MVEEVKTVFHSQDAAHGIVDALHAHFALFDELFQQDAEVDAIGVHRHVDTSIDGDADGIFLVFGHMLAREQVVDVCPVGDDHSVPAQVFLQPLREILITGVYGHSVDTGRVDHDGERSCLDGCLEGLEILLAKHLRRHIGGCAVLAGEGGAIGKIVLHTCGHIVFSQVVGVVSLIAVNLGLRHAGVDNGILAEALPDAAPSRVAAEVEHGVVDPRTVAGAALIGCGLGHGLSQRGVERGSQVDGLGEEGSCLRVGDAVVVVKAVDVGNAHALHRLLLNQTDPVLPLVDGGCSGAGRIENGAHLVFRDDGVEHGFVELPFAVGAVAAHDVEVQLKHLTDFLVKGHLGKCFLNLSLQLRIGRDGWLNYSLCHGRQGGSDEQNAG